MNTIDQKQAVIFVAVFFVIALLVNSTQGFNRSQVASPTQDIFSQETQRAAQAARQTALDAQQAAQAAKKTTEAAAAEHTRYLARYLNGNFSRKAGNKGIAIVAATENGKSN